METRPANVEGTGAIHIRQLVINALRMRPDRIIVGEVRSEEALDMLQAMNTGHDGSLTTIHANTPRDGLGRLEVMVGMANANMGIRSIRQQIASAVDLFVQVSRFSDGSRRITHITEVRRHGAGHHHAAGHLPVREDGHRRSRARCWAGSAPPASVPSSTNV